MNLNLNVRSNSNLSLKIIASAIALPPVVTSDQMDQRLNLQSGEVEHASGVKQRHVASLDTKQSELAASAVRKALAAAQLSARDVDTLVAACGVPEQAIPCNGVLIARELGWDGLGINVFDVNSTCLSFLQALDVVAAQMAVGRYRTAVVVSCDLASRGVDWDDLEVASIFGDGAAAFVVQYDALPMSAPKPVPALEMPKPSDAVLASQSIPNPNTNTLTKANSGAGIIGSSFSTYPEAWQACQIRAGGTLINSMTKPHLQPQDFTFLMDGKAVYKTAAKWAPDMLSTFLSRLGLTLEQVQWVVPHQASALSMSHMRRLLGVPTEKLIDIFAEYGNQVAASIPTALHLGIEQGKIKRGDMVLMIGTGAGLTIGMMMLNY